jgi:hypothetical protein
MESANFANWREAVFRGWPLQIIRFDRGVIVRDIILLAAKGFGAGRQSSSGVEQRTHKPLVGGSNPSSGTTLKLRNSPDLPHV